MDTLGNGTKERRLATITRHCKNRGRPHALALRERELLHWRFNGLETGKEVLLAAFIIFLLLSA